MLIHALDQMKGNMHTAEDIIDDLDRLDHGDQEIRNAYEKLRKLFKSKGLVYYELFKSKSCSTVKYLLVELQDDLGTVLITDLDTNNTFKVSDGAPVRRPKSDHERIREWINK